MKSSSHFTLAMLVVALAAAPAFAQGQSSSGRLSSTNQVLVAATGRTLNPLQAALPPRPNQIVPVLPGEIIAPLPRGITLPLPRQIVRSLPGQLIQPLPGQIVRSLPGQIVQPLPGQIVR